MAPQRPRSRRVQASLCAGVWALLSQSTPSVLLVGVTNSVMVMLLTFTNRMARPSLTPHLSALTPPLHGNTLIPPLLAVATCGNVSMQL